MGKALVIAEKPSVAQDIARALGKFERHGDYFEDDRFIVSSAIGHLVELCLPAELDKKRGKWSLTNLPIIPDQFELKPIEKTKTRFKLLKKLMRREDVTELINACDAGREGELIFRYVVKLAGVKKPVRRLWLQSMTPQAIRDGFSHLRSDDEMVPLGKAAVSRAESDWLVGINSTRAMTAFNSKSGGFQLTPVGRVQTPTLAILTEREERIRSFKPRTYYEVLAEFQVEAGQYRGRWFDEGFQKGADEDARAERLWERARAEEIRSKCAGKKGDITEEKKAASQSPPLLYDLTTLQREANARFGFSARRTLQLAQQLYERHKVLTYPRTDSRYLPEDNLGQVRSVMQSFGDPGLASHARKALDKQWLRLNRRIFNNAKVTDHHAIIPTGQQPQNLDEAQQKIFDMVARRLVAAFYPAAQFEITTRITRVEGEAFKTEGKIIVDPGWLAVYGRQTDEEAAIVPVRADEKAQVFDVEIKENETKAPARFTEATLLSSMEGAGKLVDDEELRDAMREKGLGTPATRAAIIEGLIADGYVERRARDLIATAKGMSLIHLLRTLGTEALCKPQLTGEWEFKLKQIEHGQMQRDSFMGEIRTLTTDIVEKIKQGEEPTDFPPLDVKCARCGGGPLKQDLRTFRCESCDLIVWKTLASREFAPEEIATLMTEGKIGPLEGFRSKMGRPFSAVVKLGEDFKPQFEFANDLTANKPIDLSIAIAIAPCPVCQQGTAYETDDAYVCENASGPSKSCTLRFSKIILQQTITLEQAKKLLTEGKTDLLTKFVSKKGRRFSAYLKLEGGKIGFEFEPRSSKPKKSRTAAQK
jgi:DNA topoisomerase III